MEAALKLDQLGRRTGRVEDERDRASDLAARRFQHRSMFAEASPGAAPLENRR
jgi:hypothetical protein